MGEYADHGIRGFTYSRFPSSYLMSFSNQDPLFQRAFDEAGIAMALTELDGRWLHVNRALCELVGYTPEELHRFTCQDITHPDDIGKDLAHMRDLLDGRAESYRIEKRLVDRRGRIIHVAWTSSLLREGNGDPRLFISQVQEFTGVRRPEASSEDLFQLPLALHFVAGFDGYFKKLSRSWSDALGYPVEALLNRPYLDFVHPADRRRTLEEAAKVENGHEAALFENRYQHADGSYRWLLWTAIPILDDKLVYGVAIDYTSRKQIELELIGTLQRQRRLYEELHSATSQIQQLRSGLVKVCAWTKRIYHDGKWISAEAFLRDHLQLSLTHGMSDEGAEKFLSEVGDGEWKFPSGHAT
jgi:PAS domain S-box-containing protein